MGCYCRYELHHGVRINDSALVEAAIMSDRYIADRFLPDKAIDLIDESAAKLKMEITSKPLHLDEIDRKVGSSNMPFVRAWPCVYVFCPILGRSFASLLSLITILRLQCTCSVCPWSQAACFDTCVATRQSFLRLRYC